MAMATNAAFQAALLVSIALSSLLDSAAALEDDLDMERQLIFDLTKSSIRQTIVTPKSSWCIAKSSIDDSTLQSALSYACGQTTADCDTIKFGGPCFLPNTILNHASFVFNSYYQMNAKAAGTCDFGGAATVTTENPSSGTCDFPSSGSLNQSTRVVENGAARHLVGGVCVLPIVYALAYTLL